MTVAEAKKKYPYNTVQKLGDCNRCGEEVAISPNAEDRSMTLEECRFLFFTGEVCQKCMLEVRGAIPKIYKQPW